MITVNPGNLLKFSRDKVWQRHNLPGQNRVAFGLNCPKANGLPFQLFFASGAGVVTWKLVNPIDPTGGSSVTMDAGDLIVTNKDGGGFWVTRTALTALTNAVSCGYWEAWLTVDGTVYKSVVMHFQESTQPTPVYRIRFTNSKDKDNVLYTTFSYSQFFYPTEWAFDTPRVDRETQIEVDGNGNKTTGFSRTVVRPRLEIADVPDYAIEFFASAVDMDGIQFEDLAGAVVAIPMRNTSFESRKQGVSLNIAVFEFDAVTEAFNGCQRDFVTA